jgi:hypothetical protein
MNHQIVAQIVFYLREAVNLNCGRGLIKFSQLSHFLVGMGVL